MSEQTIPGSTAGEHEPPPITSESDGWFYVDNSVRKGPVSSSVFKALLTKGGISADTQVWRKGMTDWKTLRESDLGELVVAIPPAVSSEHIGNGLVWIIAFAPLLFGVIDASLIQDNERRLAWTLATGKVHSLSHGVPWQLPYLTNIVFGWFDERRLRRAGQSSRWMMAAFVLLMPVYLFARAKKLKQRPSYAVTWIVTFITAIFLVGTVSS